MSDPDAAAKAYEALASGDYREHVEFDVVVNLTDCKASISVNGGEARLVYVERFKYGELKGERLSSCVRTLRCSGEPSNDDDVYGVPLGIYVDLDELVIAKWDAFNLPWPLKVSSGWAWFGMPYAHEHGSRVDRPVLRFTLCVLPETWDQHFRRRHM